MTRTMLLCKHTHTPILWLCPGGTRCVFSRGFGNHIGLNLQIEDPLKMALSKDYRGFSTKIDCPALGMDSDTVQNYGLL